MAKLIKNQCVLERREGCFTVEKLLHNAKFENNKKEGKLINYLLEKEEFSTMSIKCPQLYLLCAVPCYILLSIVRVEVPARTWIRAQQHLVFKGWA